MVMKGYIKTLEAGIAIVLILVSIIFLFPERTKKDPQISDTGYNCLKYLEQTGALRYYAVNNLESNLNSYLRACLPPILNYTTKICSAMPCNIQVPENRTIFLSSYMIAGNDTFFNPILINLWFWST